MSVIAPVQNIGTSERTKRYLLGVVLLVVGVALSWYMMKTLPLHGTASNQQELAEGALRTSALHHPNLLLRASVFIPFWFAWLCLFQASDSTCVVHVMKGTCKLDQNTTKVEDPVLRAKLWTKAAKVYFKTTVAALVWTACAVLISL